MIVNRAPRRRLRPIFVGLGIGLGVVGLGLGPAHSSTAAESSGAVVKADTVLSNEYGFGDNVVVRATVEATSLVNGQLSVGSAGGTTSIVRDIQVPGGSTKEFLFVVPVSTFNGLPEMQVQLRHGTDVLADKKVSFTHTADLDVTGLLPRLRSQSAQLPGRVALEPDVRRSIFVEVPAEVMDLGLGALGQLDTIAGTSADLAGLSTTGRAALIGWISAGGRLVLDDDTDLGALPESWRPQPGSYAQAGLGEVALVDGKASAGKWKEILLPSEIDQMDGGFGGGEIFMDPQMSLARRAGVSPPGLSPILIGLSLYVLVVGPVLYLVLRAMRRLTLAWLVIPALAIVTAVGVAIGGGSWRRVGHPVANLTREAYPGGSATSSETLVFSRGGGRTSIALPAGWTAAEPSIFFGEDPSTAAKRTQELGDTTSSLSAKLEAGQVATLRAQGTTNEEPLIVTAHADGASNASGQVTNPGQVAITGVAVFAPGSTTLVGDLAPGETKAFKLERIDAGRIGQEQLGQKVWTDPSLGPNNPFGIPVAVVNVGGALPPPPLPGVATAPAVAAIGGSRDADFGLWGTLSAKRGQALYPPGMVRAVGWRFGLTSEIAAGTTVQATELVTAVVPVGIGMGKLQRASVRSMNITSPFADPTGTSNGMAVSMFRIPAAATDRQIEAVLSVGVGSKIEVWSAGQWVTLDEASSRHYLIPSPVSSTGVVLIRSAIPFNGGPPMAFMTSLEEVG